MVSQLVPALLSAGDSRDLHAFQHIVERQGADIDVEEAGGVTARVTAGHDHLEVVRYLAGEEGAALDAANADGSTALIHATVSGHPKVVRYMAGERGATLDAADADGSTALMFAAGFGHLEVGHQFCDLQGSPQHDLGSVPSAYTSTFRALCQLNLGLLDGCCYLKSPA
eukprot:gnl/TRDRNA2_/TRDRNA2_164034_c0_seq4.p1 gnl/TRDRNA2_/TRDRNA2_164034_c0~~gnl/TRDRNA2_/TRDRNA2_164034_c0_seq4.p1  ORF type:complete len:169 (+),score=28.85 gnl/TRDRNA2_/TRDRNA2_164034_c0_seq4:680-1186(+)